MILVAPRTWTWLFAIWSVIGLMLTRLHLRWHEWIGSSISITQAVLTSFSDAYLWALVTAVAIWVSRRASRLPRWKSIVMHAGVLLIVPPLRDAISRAILTASDAEGRGYLEGGAFDEMFGPYLVILGVVQTLEYKRRRRHQQLEAERLQAELAKARLHMLKTQLHPHFLFNTLHAISSLMHSDVHAADRMLSQLAGLLRRSLSSFDAQKVPLRQEVDFLLSYLEIERARLGDRLRVEMDVDAALDNALVPHLILQPLVENAICHGIAPRPRGGSMEVRIDTVDDRVRIEVADDGPGMSVTAASSTHGIGLSNTRARLATLYGEGHSMEIESSSDGFVVRIELPLELAHEHEPMTSIA